MTQNGEATPAPAWALGPQPLDPSSDRGRQLATAWTRDLDSIRQRIAADAAAQYRDRAPVAAAGGT